MIVEQDTKAVQVLTRRGEELVLEPPGPAGWLSIRALGVEIRSELTGAVARLALRLAGERESARIV